MAGGTYRRVGKGAHNVVALHGCFGSADAWQPILPYLVAMVGTCEMGLFHGHVPLRNGNVPLRR